MGIALKSVDDLQEHLLGVFQRSDHHAGEVNEVLLAIAGGILWRKNPGDHVRVNEKEGAGGNVIWFRIGIQRFALLYNHRSRRIELMFGGRRGHLIHAFTNATPLAEVSKVFSTLGMSDEEANAYLAERAEVKAKFPKGHKGRQQPASVPPAEAPVAVEPVAMEVTAPVEPVAAEPVAAVEVKPARRARKPAVARTEDAKPAVEVAEPAESAGPAKPAKKVVARKARKAIEALPEAIQLPLVAIAEPAPKKVAAPRKRRMSTKPAPEAAELTVVVATDPLELAPAAAPKPRTRSRAKAASAAALQPA